MITTEIGTLAGQADAFTRAFLAGIPSEEDPRRTKVLGFSTQFYGNAAQMTLVTENEITKLTAEIFENETLTQYVFGLRFYALAAFSPEELRKIAQSFGYANANVLPGEVVAGKRFPSEGLLPSDSDQWKAEADKLVSLYFGNTWILPLLSLGLLMGEADAPT